MGLAQREIEAAGLATVTLSPIWRFTTSVGAPRVAAIEHPPGLTVGRAGDAQGQTEVLCAALGVLDQATTPGQVVQLSMRWPETRARFHPPVPPPIVKLMRRKPWLFVRMLTGNFPD